MTIYTYGVFDLFHIGHLNMLKQAKALGDKLIVGVFSDKVAESFKREPIIPQEQRLALIEGLGVADKVVIQDCFSPQNLITFHKVDIVAKGEGAGWNKDFTPEYSCQSVLLNYTEGISTSAIIKKINDNYIQQSNREITPTSEGNNQS